MRFGLRSLRRRIIAMSLVLGAALLGAAYYTNTLVEESVRRYRVSLEEQSTYSEHLADLKYALYNLESSIYRYATLQDISQQATVATWLNEAMRRIKVLNESPIGRARQDLHRETKSLIATIARLDRETRDLMHTIEHLELRFPAQPIITDVLYPLNIRFSTAVEEALADAEINGNGQRGQMRLYRLLNEVRYLWSQQISVSRVYMANRSGVFGMPEAGMRQNLQNREHYLDRLNELLEQLVVLEHKGALGLVQSESLMQMREVALEYERQFAEVVRIYESDRWRADIPIMRNTIQPLFEQLWETFERVESQLAALNSGSVMESLRLAGTVSGFLWMITVVALLTFTALYLGYEVALRRPIEQVIHALQALGRGDSYTPLLKTGTYETDSLLKAFRDMQNQVYAREMRLASILDNASEGIITISEDGLIETFNNAAESLFLYRAEEVIGRNVNILMPPPVRDEHDGYLKRYLETGEQRIIGNEINVSARRKDGSVFPMAIKVGEVQIDGRRYFTAIVSDISERKAMLDHLRHLAEHDSLTGLFNRQYFSEELERVMQRSLRQGGIDCALLYVDLDNFKYVNDTMGHLAGDQVLVEVAGLLTKRGRKTDLVARLGGDEFAVLVYDVDEVQAQQTAEGYRQLLADYSFQHEGKVIDIGCSIGVAMFEPDIATREELMARADVACHTAKRAGRNSVHVYRADDRARVDTMYADMGWARTIKHAIEHDRFVFALQPIVTIPSREEYSHELLLRMWDENGEIIMPSGFVPSAERFGLMLDLDRWVVQHALAFLAQPEYAHYQRVTINLSGMSVGNRDILRLITEGMERYHIDPRRIGFEITETIAVADLGAASEFLGELRALGCATALDDFGVGYCSFAYLKDLPVDYVKIDGSFVRDIVRDSVQLAMVKSMNEIAHAMGKRTVAEFVDSEEVLQRLAEIGVDYAQGYLVGRPLLAED